MNSENSERLWERIQEVLSGTVFPEEGQDCYLFGGGLSGSLAFPMLSGDIRLKAVCDHDRRKQGRVYKVSAPPPHWGSLH